MTHSPTNHGFTLIEALVTGVLIAIIAAIAIPSYLGYVQSTRQEAVENLAQTAAAAANTYYRKTGAVPTLDDLNLFYDATKFSVTVGDPNISVSMIGYASRNASVTYK